MSLNRAILMGNLTRDPEQRSTANGNTVTNFGLALNRRYTSGGEKREETTFVDVESWGKQAELIAQYFTKGKPIVVEGRLKQDSWESPNGEKRSKLVVVLEQFQFVNGGGEEASGLKKESKTDAEPETSSAGVNTDIPF